MPYALTEPHIAAAAAEPQVPTPPQVLKFWLPFPIIFALIFIPLSWMIYSPGEDHYGAIPLGEDNSWYFNYEIGFSEQDNDIMFHGIGNSIAYAQKADIIFLGWSRLLFGINWRTFDDFAQTHHIRMFNLGLADVYSGEFYRDIIEKWQLHPKLWIINTDRDLADHTNGFFYMTMTGSNGMEAAAKVARYPRFWSYKNVIGRNLRWHIKMTLNSLRLTSYRSVKTGNWYLENWPNYTSTKNPKIEPMTIEIRGQNLYQKKRTDWSCPVIPEEVTEARQFIQSIGGQAVLIQMPSAFACAERVEELASRLGVPAFTMDATQFSTTDGGGHLDSVSSRKYSAALFTWLEQLPQFQRLFPN